MASIAPEMALAVAAVTFIVLSPRSRLRLSKEANSRCEAVLREQNSLFEAALHHLPVGLSMFDGKQRLIMCNPAYRTLMILLRAIYAREQSFSDIVLDYVKRSRRRATLVRASTDARDWIYATRRKAPARQSIHRDRAA